MKASLQVKNGRYYVVLFDRAAPKGKQYKWVSTGLLEKNNKRKAEQIMKEVLEQYEKQETLTTCKTLFSDLVNQWLVVAKTTVRSNSYDIYKVTANAHVIPYFQKLNISLQDLQPIHIQKYFTSKHEGTKGKKGLSPNTLVKHRTVINETLKQAIKQGLIKSNPMLGVTCPSKVEHVPKYYDAEQLQELFGKVDDSVIKPAVILAATYGLRRSETLGLTWSAVNFNDGNILINRTIVRVGSKAEERDIMKSKKSRRTMPLMPHVAEYLKALKVQQAENKLFLGTGYNDNDFICKWDDGTPFKPDYVSRKFKRVLVANGLPLITFHELRHSSASLLINMGFTLKEVQEWLGHADIASTNIYAHLEYKSKERMANRVNEVLKIQRAI